MPKNQQPNESEGQFDPEELKELDAAGADFQDDFEEESDLGEYGQDDYQEEICEVGEQLANLIDLLEMVGSIPGSKEDPATSVGLRRFRTEIPGADNLGMSDAEMEALIRALVSQSGVATDGVCSSAAAQSLIDRAKDTELDNLLFERVAELISIIASTIELRNRAENAGANTTRDLGQFVATLVSELSLVGSVLSKMAAISVRKPEMND